MSRLPEPSQPDYCGGCDRDRPLYLLEGADGDHVHRCRDCLLDALAAGDDLGRTATQSTLPACTARAEAPDLASDALAGATGAAVSDQRPPGHDPRAEPINCLLASLYELAGAAGSREGMLAHGLAALAELERRLGQTLERRLGQTLERRLGQTEESLRTAEEVVVRQKALLETAAGMIEEARRWARSLLEDGPAAEEPVVLNEPEFAPAWLTADGPRHTARPPRTPGGLELAVAAHELRLAALDRWLADVGGGVGADHRAGDGHRGAAAAGPGPAGRLTAACFRTSGDRTASPQLRVVNATARRARTLPLDSRTAGPLGPGLH